MDELYDLVNDPYELTNLANRQEYAELLKGLRADLMVELDAVGDCALRSPWMRDQLKYDRKATK